MRLAGAALLASAAAASAAPAERVDLKMVEYRFEPAQLTFRHGVPYRLHLDNKGKELHEFTAPAFLAAVEVENRDVLAPGGNEIVMPPGAHKDLYFVAAKPGRYPFYCADHDWAGMTGQITVE